MCGYIFSKFSKLIKPISIYVSVLNLAINKYW